MANLAKNDHIITLKDGRKLGYSEFGDPKGKPLLYFHGWPTSRLMATETGIVAKVIGVRVISIDRPGYGLSDYQKNRTLLDWADDVIELADQLKMKKFAVMGVSGGGPYAAVCAYKIPNRVTKAGIVVGLAPTYVPGILKGMSKLSQLGWANYAKFPVLRTSSALFHFFNARFGPSLGLHRFMFGAKADQKIFSDVNIRKRIRRNYQESFRNGYKGVELDLKLYTNDWGFKLSDIKSKVLLFYGADDKNVGIVMGKYYASQIKNSKLTIYPGEGHLCRINHEEEILKALTS